MSDVPEVVGPFSKGQIKRIAVQTGVSVEVVMRIVRATLDAQKEKADEKATA